MLGSSSSVLPGRAGGRILRGIMLLLLVVVVVVMVLAVVLGSLTSWSGHSATLTAVPPLSVQVAAAEAEAQQAVRRLAHLARVLIAAAVATWAWATGAAT